jgi:hypothetical protein
VGYSLESKRLTGLSLSLSGYSADIHVRDDGDIKALGVLSKIETILLKRENKILNLLASSWMFLLFNGLIWFVIWLFPSKENEILKLAILISILLIGLFWFIWSLKVQSKKHSLIYLYDSSAPSFFERNKDNIILIVISAFFGAIMTIVIQRLS